MLKGIEIIDLARDNHLDSHKLSINQPPASDECLSCGGESSIVFNEASTGNPVTLRQKATSGGNFLKHVGTSGTERGGVDNLKPGHWRGFERQ